MQDLGSLGGKAPQSDQSFALGINNADHVVGYTYLPAEEAGALAQPQAVAFLYHNGVMKDLNEMIGSAAKTYQLTAATAINDKGQIMATAFDREAQLLPRRLVDAAPDRSGPAPVPFPHKRKALRSQADSRNHCRHSSSSGASGGFAFPGEMPR